MTIVIILCALFITGGITSVVIGSKEHRPRGLFFFVFGGMTIFVFTAYFILRPGEELGWWPHG